MGLGLSLMEVQFISRQAPPSQAKSAQGQLGTLLLHQGHKKTVSEISSKFGKNLDSRSGLQNEGL